MFEMGVRVMVFLAMALLPMEYAAAGFFGADNYEECMLDKMKGQERHMKSLAKKACEIKFPKEEDITEYTRSIPSFNDYKKDFVAANKQSVDDSVIKAFYFDNYHGDSLLGGKRIDMIPDKISATEFIIVIEKNESPYYLTRSVMDFSKTECGKPSNKHFQENFTVSFKKPEFQSSGTEVKKQISNLIDMNEMRFAIESKCKPKEIFFGKRYR